MTPSQLRQRPARWQRHAMVTSMISRTLKLLRGDGSGPLVVKSKHFYTVNQHIPHPIMDFVIMGSPYYIRLALLPGGPDVPVPAKQAGRGAGGTGW